MTDGTATHGWSIGRAAQQTQPTRGDDGSAGAQADAAPDAHVAEAGGVKRHPFEWRFWVDGSVIIDRERIPMKRLRRICAVCYLAPQARVHRAPRPKWWPL